MVLGVETWVVAVLGVALFVGAVVQGTVGLGLGLVGAPVTGLVAPELLPEVILWLAMLMALQTMVTEHRGTDWRGLALALPPRVVGTAIGVWVVATAPIEVIGVAVGLMVLLSVLLTVRTVTIPVNRVSLPIAGLVSGVAGTATSIGGPPLAVLYQHHRPYVLRPTLAAYFAIGAALSLVGLGIAGQLDVDTTLLALLLSPVLALGIVVSLPIRRRVPARLIRTGVLTVCAASSLALLVRSLV
ncbi:TSUP family transporter [Nocardioides sp. GXQ0305]|uniref:TSUP family transporter n=1 Tax=Nocardioides sp. GXQ0305 TaxID=3423912 RepID=UPI003D7E0522